MSDLDAYGSVIDGLRDQAKECKVSLLLTQCCVRITCLFFHQSCIIDKLATGIILLRSFVSDFFSVSIEYVLAHSTVNVCKCYFTHTYVHNKSYGAQSYIQSDCAVQRSSI